MSLACACGGAEGGLGPGEACVRSFECAPGLACVLGACSADPSMIGGDVPDLGIDVDLGAVADMGSGADMGAEADMGSEPDMGARPDLGAPQDMFTPEPDMFTPDPDMGPVPDGG